MQYVKFCLNSDLFGIPIVQVQGFTRLLRISPVIGHDNRIAGLINLRGRIATVIDLKNCLEITKHPAGQPDKTAHVNRSGQKMIILNTDDQLPEEAGNYGIKSYEEPIVLLVDRILDVVNVASEEFFAPPANIDNAFIEGVVKQEDNLISIISITELTDEISATA